MSISPFSVRPLHPREQGSPGDERRRARLVVAIATLGIAATLLAYGISPGVRHAVGHAAHSVKHAVSNVFDHDKRGSADDRSGKREAAKARTATPQSGQHAASARKPLAKPRPHSAAPASP
jgi:hypothetical protein